jgi:hypothetical protein
VLAERYQWTPAEVDALDPDFFDELLVKLDAEVDAERQQKKARERRERLRRQQDRMRQSMGAGWMVEEAEVE